MAKFKKIELGKEKSAGKLKANGKIKNVSLFGPANE